MSAPSTKHNRGDLITSLVFLALGGWLLRETFAIGDDFAIGVGMDAATYPQILAIVTIVLGLILGIRSLLGFAGTELSSPPGDNEVAAKPAKVPMALASFATYTLLLHLLGFLFATPLLLATIMVIAGERRLSLIVPTAIGLTLVVQILVFYGFSIVLPEGPLRYLYS